MRSTLFTLTGALAGLASAQTWTDCNPMEKDCPNDPAMPQTFETNFKAGKDAVKGWKQTAGSLTYGADGAQFTVAKKGDAPTIQSEGFLHFGYVEVKMKAAPGQGIISSIVLQSQDLDEVDWEWIGGQEGKVQMNYFGKGNTTTYDRMIEAPVATTQTEMHTYALNWTAESLTWIIDNKPVRTLNYADANGGKNYPQTPCNVRLGNWPGGDSENEGTRQWAGGEVDYKTAPFTMTVESIKVINYSPGTEYKWKDKTGSFGSIEVIGAGNSNGAPQNSVVIEPSATASAQPLKSGINAPTSVAAGKPTPAVSGGGSGFQYPTGKPAPAHSQGGKDEPCGCGTKTVTVTGPPPASFTTEYSALPPSSILAVPPQPSSSKVPIVSSIPPVPTPSAPVVAPTPPAAPPATPQLPTGGIIVETSPPPVVPGVTPTGVPAVPVPSGNATLSAPPAIFTGAARQQSVGGVALSVVLGAMALVF